jgi:hypothetical protein
MQTDPLSHFFKAFIHNLGLWRDANTVLTPFDWQKISICSTTVEPP